MTTIKINQQLKRIEIKEFEIENQIVFNYFDNIPASERDDKLLRAIYIGVLAPHGRPYFLFLIKNLQ